MAKTPEEIAAIREAALKHLAEHKEELERFSCKIEEQDDKWQAELALLQRRVNNNIVEIFLDREKNESVAIRGSLSDFEVEKIAQLYDLREKLDQNIDKEEISEIGYIIMGTVTANPLLTSKWFREHRKEYSTEDMLIVVLSYFEMMTKRATRVAEIQEFRRK